MNTLQTIPIIPNGLRYWVLPDAKEDTTIRVGNVTLSGDNSADREPPVQGRIVAVGDALATSTDSRAQGDGFTEFSRASLACKYDRHELVIFGKYAGTPHTFEGTEYTILHEDEILGKVIETPFDGPEPEARLSPESPSF